MLSAVTKNASSSASSVICLAAGFVGATEFVYDSPTLATSRSVIGVGSLAYQRLEAQGRRDGSDRG